MNLSAPISYKFNTLSLNEKIFVYDSVDDKILFPASNHNNIRAWLDDIILNYPVQWSICVKLDKEETHTFSIFNNPNHTSQFNIHVHQLNDKINGGLLLFNVSDKNNNSFDELKKERNEFFDLALHDLQSPVRKLYTLIERMLLKEETMFSAEAKPYLERVKQVTSELSSLTKGLSSLFGAVDESAAFKNCDLNIITRLAAEEVYAHAESPIEIKIDHLPIATGDFDQLKIVFINLFHNALKFSEAGKKAVIAVHSKIADGRDMIDEQYSENTYYCITVKDNGIGFMQENAVKIFEPFIRLNGKSAYPGSGFGLAVCAKIIEHHKGKIYADATPSGGCTVSIVLPEKISR